MLACGSFSTSKWIFFLLSEYSLSSKNVSTSSTQLTADCLPSWSGLWIMSGKNFMPILSTSCKSLVRTHCEPLSFIVQRSPPNDLIRHYFVSCISCLEFKKLNHVLCANSFECSAETNCLSCYFLFVCDCHSNGHWENFLCTDSKSRLLRSINKLVVLTSNLKSRLSGQGL